uniref:Uncharacterized protein n=1 Tax=Megaselia scalaris TaxID=36166 RepID=T1GPR7_MEGSC
MFASPHPSKKPQGTRKLKSVLDIENLLVFRKDASCILIGYRDMIPSFNCQGRRQLLNQFPLNIMVKWSPLITLDFNSHR